MFTFNYFIAQFSRIILKTSWWIFQSWIPTLQKWRKMFYFFSRMRFLTCCVIFSDMFLRVRQACNPKRELEACFIVRNFTSKAINILILHIVTNLNCRNVILFARATKMSQKMSLWIRKWFMKTALGFLYNSLENPKIFEWFTSQLLNESKIIHSNW